MYQVTQTTNMYRRCEGGNLAGAGREIQAGTPVDLLYVDGRCARIQLPDGSKVFFPIQYLEEIIETPPDQPPMNERKIVFYPGDGTHEDFVPRSSVG